jgi:hypothetical protein
MQAHERHQLVHQRTDHVVHDRRVDHLDQGRESADVGEQDADVPAFASGARRSPALTSQ